MVMHNTHQPTDEIRTRISDLACAGIPLHLIADIVDLNDDTIRKYYRKELDTSQALVVDRIAKVVTLQALSGNEKSQALYLKTQGAKFGFVEKQVVEQISNNETQELREQIAALEDKYSKDY